VAGSAKGAAGDLDTAARCDGAASGVLRVGCAQFGRESVHIERRMRPVRSGHHVQYAARVSAFDPRSIVEELLTLSAE